MNADTFDIIDYTDHLSSDDYNKVKKHDLAEVMLMDKNGRDEWMRNQPCICGSGKKFKKCCWDKSRLTVPENS